MMSYVRYLCMALCVLVSSTLHAQLSDGGFPQPEMLGGVCLKSFSQERVDMPTFDMDSLDKDSSTRNGALRFAYGFKTHLTPSNSGVTTTLPDGSTVWRLHIRSKGAVSLNLIFDRFRLSEGDRLFVYAPDRSQILGAYTSRNNHDNGVLATGIIEDEEVVVELTTLRGSDSELSVGEVNHGYRSIRALPGMGSAHECNVEVSCDDEVPDNSRRSSVLIQIDGKTLCSGSLINNTSEDATPYVLSAAHCMESSKGLFANSLAEADELAATCVFYFNYEAPYCKQYVQGSLEMSVSGANAVSFLRNSDLLLLRLKEMPPHEYNTYYSGWNLSSNVEAPIYSIHHSQGEMKKFAISKEAPVAGSFECCTDFMFLPDNHWIVTSWERGMTEAGSSGGPLFDSQGHIIGALSGGDIYRDPCHLTNIADAYYRINHVWSGRNSSTLLSSKLDPVKSGVRILEGLEPYGVPCDRLSNFTSEDHLRYSEEDNYVAGNNQLGYTQFAEKFSEGGRILGVYFVAETGYYSETDSVWIKIYDGKEVPENELYRKRVRISDIFYNNRTKKFITTENTRMEARDNYVHFDSPVMVHDPFFVVLEVPESPKYPFAVYASEEKKDGVNTAFFKDGTVWKPFTQHPSVMQPTSLLLNPLMLLFSRTDVADAPKQQRCVVSPNPTEGELSVQSEIVPDRIELYSIDGRKWSEVTCNARTTDIQMTSYAQGIYILKVFYDGEVERIKIIKK